jgi:hypothetical protein
MVTINFFAIILAALSTMVVGSLWYGPLFGKAWSRLAKVKKDPAFGPAKGVILYGGAFLTSLVSAFVLAYFAYITNRFLGGTFLNDTLMTGALLWLGFTAARLYMHDSFEGRRRKLTLLNITHELVTIGIMALIIGAMGV